MADSIFTKIINGEIPSHKIYEDEKTFAFLDIHPKASGHTLVVPKNPVPFIWDLPDDDYSALMVTTKKVGNRLREVLKPQYVGIQVEGMAVPHAHIHVFPFNSVEEFHKVPDLSTDPDDAALAEIAERLSF